MLWFPLPGRRHRSVYDWYLLACVMMHSLSAVVLFFHDHSPAFHFKGYRCGSRPWIVIGRRYSSYCGHKPRYSVNKAFFLAGILQPVYGRFFCSQGTIPSTQAAITYQSICQTICTHGMTFSEVRANILSWTGQLYLYMTCILAGKKYLPSA